jgi:hypothetical protein
MSGRLRDVYRPGVHALRIASGPVVEGLIDTTANLAPRRGPLSCADAAVAASANSNTIAGILDICSLCRG